MCWDFGEIWGKFSPAKSSAASLWRASDKAPTTPLWPVFGHFLPSSPAPHFLIRPTSVSRMLNLEHEYISYLVHHSGVWRQVRLPEGQPDWAPLAVGHVQPVQVPSRDVRGTLSPQWRHLLTVDDQIYHEICVEFYSTFSHVVPASQETRPHMEFILGGQPRVLTYDAFAQAMGSTPPT